MQGKATKTWERCRLLRPLAAQVSPGSRLVEGALEAADLLAEASIHAWFIDPRTTVPLETQTRIDSVKKASRAIVSPFHRP